MILCSQPQVGTWIKQSEIFVRTFKLTQVSVDVLNRTANVMAIDQPTIPGSHAKVVNVQFPFSPPDSEGQEKDRVISEAKKILQQAINEI